MLIWEKNRWRDDEERRKEEIKCISCSWVGSYNVVAYSWNDFQDRQRYPSNAWKTIKLILEYHIQQRKRHHDPRHNVSDKLRINSIISWSRNKSSRFQPDPALIVQYPRNMVFYRTPTPRQPLPPNSRDKPHTSNQNTRKDPDDIQELYSQPPRPNLPKASSSK